ncbi:MAG: gliding motility protein GldN [Muribaculaceae bacterium]|nr:gliding motility protein GldN [Muribaculaceae bacterium]
MKIYRFIVPVATVAAICISTFTPSAQVENAGGVRRRAEREKNNQSEGPTVTQRMQGFFENKETHDADLEYMRKIYRQLDLQKEKNQPLYFPEDIVDGQMNLFRIIMNGVVDGTVPAYEYLDGREVFTDKYKVNVPEMLDRFGIYFNQTGSGKNEKLVIEEADVPTAQVLNYYILEKWEFDRRSNRMKTRVEAICPVLNRTSDFGGEARYPMFWVKFDALRPFLAQQYVFLSDDNNLAQYSLDDYFNLGMYDGEIYKTTNLRNLSMNQMFPDEDDRKHAQDSIDNRLRTYGQNRWVPTREEYLAMKEKEAEAAKRLAAGDTLPDRTVVEESPVETKTVKKTTTSSTKKRTTTKKRASTRAKKSSSNNANSNATKSVRRRKK